MPGRSVLILPLALLAACDRAEQPGGKSGQETSVKIDTPGFKADIDLPFLNRISDRMEVAGLKLYPGSTIGGVEVAAAKNSNDDRVTMRFNAPADPAKVADWFQQQFAANKFEARRTPTGFAGTRADGDWFTLDLRAAANGTAGEFRLGERQP